MTTLLCLVSFFFGFCLGVAEKEDVDEELAETVTETSTVETTLTETETITKEPEPVPPPAEEPIREEAEDPVVEEAPEEPVAPAPDPEPVSAYFSNCAEARSAGASPLYAGMPGYRLGLDRDGDGVACE